MNGQLMLKACARALRQRFVLRLSESPARVRVALLAGVAVLLAIALYFLYGEHQRRTLPGTINALVLDASARLHTGLAEEASDASPLQAQGLEAHYAAVAQHLLKLRAMDTSAIEDHARAAEDYLLTAREILRRRAADYRNRAEVADTLRALGAHMRSDDRTGSWITEAVQHKERLEARWRRYRLTAEALGSLLQQYPDSRRQLAAFVLPAQLAADRDALTARQRALAALKQLADDVERARQLDAYR